MSTFLQRTSTASSNILFAENFNVKLYAPISRMIAYNDYKDWGVFGISNSGAKSTIIRPDDLGWSIQETKETRTKLATFEEDWLAPGMEAYDNL